MTRFYPLFALSFLLGTSLQGGSPSTWTGTISSDLLTDGNWTNEIPTSGTAVFNGNGANSPLSRRMETLILNQIQFTSATDLSVITALEAQGSAGVIANSGVMANFNIYEHQPDFYPPANFQISSGPAGDGGGVIAYNLQAYGQLYAYSGSTGATTVTVAMTGGNNYFSVSGPGSCTFDQASSDATTDQIVLSDGSTLVLRGSGNTTIAGIISGGGSLTQNGVGTLSLTNANTYTGGTVINQGTVEVQGSLASGVTVGTAGRIKGAGSIGGTLTLSGTVAPGNSIGTINVTNLIATSTSLYSCEINSVGESDKIVASGTMSLAGTLEILPLDLAFTAPQTYTILQATGGISGTFGAIQSSAPSLRALSYGTNVVTLTYLPLSVIGLDPNGESTADCFTSLLSSDANQISSQLLTFPYSQIQGAFRQMSPSQFSAPTWAQISNILLVQSSYAQHLKETFFLPHCSKKEPLVWIDLLGQWEREEGQSNEFDYQDWATGLSAGGDTSWGAWRFGGAASYIYSKAYWDPAGSDTDLNSCYGGVYGSWNDSFGYLLFSAIGGYNHYDTDRRLFFGTLQRLATSSHQGGEFLTGLEGGAPFRTPHFNVGPFARVHYVYLWQQGYQESGAESLNLRLQSHTDQLLQSEAGVAFMGRGVCDSEHPSGTFIPRLELSYLNQTPLGSAVYTASFENSSCSFTTSSWSFERNLGSLLLNLTYLTASEKLALSFEYNGQFGKSYLRQSGKFLFNLRF